jgi:hypothetical protein
LSRAFTYPLRDGASDIVNAYYKSIGGRPERPTEKAKPGRKRKSMGDNKLKTATPTTAPAAGPKKRRKAAPKETEEDTRTPEANGSWLPKGKNWDKEVTNVETIVRGEGEEGLVAFLEFNNGRKARVGIDVCYEKCPLKVHRFQHCKSTIQILTFESDAQVLRIAPVSQVIPASVRNNILTISSVFKDAKDMGDE